MPTTRTTHYKDGEEYERRETTRDDGSKVLVTSKVTNTPLGRLGSNIVEETRVDPSGNSLTKTR